MESLDFTSLHVDGSSEDEKDSKPVPSKPKRDGTTPSKADKTEAEKIAQVDAKGFSEVKQKVAKGKLVSVFRLSRSSNLAFRLSV